MTQLPSRSVIVVGGGITGLTIAVALQASGHKVTLIARDAPEDTASGVAAGMIAPAMEAMNEPDPAFSYQRLRNAQQAWREGIELWPPRLRFLWQFAQEEGHSYFIWPENEGDGPPDRLVMTGAELQVVSAETRKWLNLQPELQILRVMDDGRVPALHLLKEFEAHFLVSGGNLIRGEVYGVEAKHVRVRHGGWVNADQVVIAAGYGAYGLRHPVPVLKKLSPIKGHLLDLSQITNPVVLRSTKGYLVGGSTGGAFGATMQAGQSDLDIEPAVVADLKGRAKALFPDLELDKAVPRTGIRASTPDGWPLIGRDPASGVLVATGMRRNGYVFAPMAAKIILALVEGRESPDGGIYRPDRFRNPEN